MNDIGNNVMAYIRRSRRINTQLTASTTMDELAPPGKGRCSHISLVMGLAQELGLDKAAEEKIENCNTVGGIIRVINKFTKGGNGRLKK